MPSLNSKVFVTKFLTFLNTASNLTVAPEKESFENIEFIAMTKNQPFLYINISFVN